MVHSNPIVAAIKQLETERNRALVAADAAAIDRLYSDDYTSAVNNTYRTKAEVLADLKSGTLKVSAASNDETNVRVYGNTAVVWFTLHLVGPVQGKTTPISFRYVDVWVNRDGVWKCVATQSTRVASKE